MIGLLNTKADKQTSRNYAKILGRLGLVDPLAMGKEIERFGVFWCGAMKNSPPDETKTQAYKGFMHMMYSNQSLSIGILAHFIESFANFDDAPE